MPATSAGKSDQIASSSERSCCSNCWVSPEPEEADDAADDIPDAVDDAGREDDADRVDDARGEDGSIDSIEFWSSASDGCPDDDAFVIPTLDNGIANVDCGDDDDAKGANDDDAADNDAFAKLLLR
jgi:hypothetical protein